MRVQSVSCALGDTGMDYYVAMLLVLIALALVLLFLLLHLKLFRPAFAFSLAVLVFLFLFTQKHPRNVIAIEDVPKKQGPAKMCGAG
jgi:glucan phosphoethanolaminetransferase (alkaline phosphatase superfamily)